MSDKEELEKLKKTFEEFIQTSFELQNSYEVLKEESSRLSLYLSNILENMNSAILVFDNNYFLKLWNSLSKKYFPILEGKEPPVNSVDIARSNNISVNDIKSILENTNTPVVMEREINGQKRWLEIDSSDFFDNKNQKVGFLLVIDDITELKKLQIKSQQEDRLRVMGELAAEVAHEIRNPLGSIELMVTLLQDDHKKDARSSELLSRIRNSVNNMNHIVTNILLYTKDLQLELSEFTVEKLITEAESIAMDTILKKKIIVDKELHGPTLTADLELLKQSIANLLINAAQAVSQEGRITISTETEKDSLLLKISDNGTGIPQNLKEQIFKPFFTTKNTGTGLGLAMVKRVIEAHSGKISFESDSEGTTFIIKFPKK
ncbi:MAG: PAS domain S-box protein [bacterium]|nr:PAS domain S-box protein [bacterium]